MTREPLLPAFLSLVSGTALFLSFPEFSLFPLAWMALVPYLHFLLRKPSWKRVLFGHLLMSVTYFGGVLYWIPRVLLVYGALGWIASLLVFAVMLLTLSLFLLPFSLLTRWTAHKSGRWALLCAPGFWVLTELCRNYYAVNGFPWALLGHSQYPYPWVTQVVDISGVYLVSLLVVAGNCAVLAAWQARSFKPVVVFVLFFVAANLYGLYRLYVWQPDEGAVLEVAVVQPNIGLAEDRQHYAEKYFETLPRYYAQAARSGARWVIFPEAPNPFFYQEDFYFRTFWQRQVEVHGSYLLFNTTFAEKNSPVRYFNSALLLDPRGREAYRYDKNHLVPFGEYIPLQHWLGGFFEPLVQEVGGYSPGSELVVGKVRETEFATLICYEGIFPELSRQAVYRGAELLVNITNDSWYGHTAAPRQHLEIAAFRAIEMRKPFLRCANSGYSAVIDVFGNIRQELGLFQEDMLAARISGNAHRSIYSYVGEWLNIFVVTVSVLLALGIRWAKGKGAAH